MRLEKIHIKQFRGVEDATVEFDDYTVLIGRNGAGKSTFLKALDFFYTPHYGISLDDFYYNQTDKPIIVEVTFRDLNIAAQKEFAAYIIDDKLVVTKKATWEAGSVTETYHGTKEQFKDFIGIKAKTGREKNKAYKQYSEEHPELKLPSAGSQEQIDIIMAKFEQENKQLCELMPDDGKFFGFKNVGTGKLDKFTDYLLIPAVRDASEDAVEAKNSALKRLLDIAVRRALNTSQRVDEFRKEVTESYKKLLEDDRFELGDIQRKLTASLNIYSPRAEIKLHWQDLPELKVNEPTALANLVEDGFEGDISRKGHGLQRTYVMSLLHFLSEAESGKVSFTEGTSEEQEEIDTPSLIIAIEEPELYQHPLQARFLAITLQALASNDEHKDTIQSICTSHSPYFVDIESLENIRVVTKSFNEETSSKMTLEVRRAELDRIAKRLENIHERDGFTIRRLKS